MWLVKQMGKGLLTVALFVGLVLIAVVFIVYKAWNAAADHHMEAQTNRIAPAVDRIASTLKQMEFNPTREIYIKKPTKQIKVDSISKRVAICDYQTSSLTCLNFRDILDCELIEDSHVVCSSSLVQQITNSLDISDVVNSLTVRILTSDINHPQIVIEMLSYRMEKNNYVVPYQPVLEHAREIYAIFNAIVLSNRNQGN